MFAHLNGAIDYKSLGSKVKNSFAVHPQTMAQFIDPYAIQPQNSLLAIHPELGIGFMNVESRRPKK